MQHDGWKLNRKMIHGFSAALLMISILISVYAYRRGLFTSVDAIQEFTSGLGCMGSAVFILIQIVQVIIPILPGGIGCLGGVILFGAWKGFLYNYIGICIGSFGAFLIAKYTGKPILSVMFSEKLIEKYDKWTAEEGRFTKFFALAIFCPVAPDDFLCYLAGTTAMTWKEFVIIILLGKPFAIALYSLGLTAVFQHFVMG